MSQSDYQSFAFGGANPAANVFQQQQQQQSQQSQQQLPQGGMNNGGMYQPNGAFTSAPFTQGYPTTAVSSAQQMNLRQSISPNQSSQPFFGNAPQQQAQQQQLMNQQVKYPMAAPPLPQTPINTKQFAAAQSTSNPPTPQSPASAALEQSRIAALFEINLELFEEMNRLQVEGKGGALNPQYQAQMRQQNLNDKMATDEYIQTLRRLQANLSYLGPRGNPNGASKQMPPGPAHMTPPPHMPQLQAKYDKLKELFPGYTGLDQRRQPTGASPVAGPGQGNPLSA